jgi:hypothetical protein
MEAIRMKSFIFVALSIVFTSLAFAQTPEEMELPDTLAEIPQALKPPVIDGDLKEWTLSAGIFVSEKATQTLQDCSGIFCMMWDENNLYFAAKVYDDELVQGKTGAAIWEEDDVQFDLDIDRGGDKNVTTFSDDDCQTGFSPGDFNGEKPEIWGWNPGGGRPMDGPENAEIASAEFDKGWIIEARIGIDEFNADLTGLKKLEEGMKIGFGRCINDYDIKSGEGGVSSGGAWNDTSKMYDVELVGPLSVEPNQKLTTQWGDIKH